MDSYRVRLLSSAEKELRGVAKSHLKRLAEKIERLAATPRPHGCEKLSGEERYRIRQGDWRVVYAVDDVKKEVIVYRIGHRREIYR